MELAVRTECCWKSEQDLKEERIDLVHCKKVEVSHFPFGRKVR